jgi:hypothetical protein
MTTRTGDEFVVTTIDIAPRQYTPRPRPGELLFDRRIFRKDYR